MLGAQVSHQGVGHAQAAVGSGQGAHELLHGIDEGGQSRSGIQAQLAARVHHGGGGHDAAVDHGGGGQSEVLADQGDRHGAAQNGGSHAHHGAQHGPPLLFQRGDIHGRAHVEEQEVLAQAGNACKAGDLHDVGGIDAGHEQDQEAHHDNEHGGDLRLCDGAYEVAHEEDEQYGKYCLIGCHFHFLASLGFTHTFISTRSFPRTSR